MVVIVIPCILMVRSVFVPDHGKLFPQHLILRQIAESEYTVKDAHKGEDRLLVY